MCILQWNRQYLFERRITGVHLSNKIEIFIVNSLLKLWNQIERRFESIIYESNNDSLIVNRIIAFDHSKQRNLFDISDSCEIKQLYFIHYSHRLESFNFHLHPVVYARKMCPVLIPIIPNSKALPTRISFIPTNWSKYVRCYVWQTSLIE